MIRRLFLDAIHSAPAVVVLGLIAGTATAAPVCSVSQPTQERILKALCTHQGESAPDKACILKGAENNIIEAIAYITLFERCGDRAMADQASRGLSRLYAAIASLASCVDVDLDAESMIAYGRARAKTNANGRACTANSETVLKSLQPAIAKYAAISVDPKRLQSLFEEAGVTIDATGKVSEK